jgi:hypothetical protein
MKILKLALEGRGTFLKKAMAVLLKPNDQLTVKGVILKS